MSSDILNRMMSDIDAGMDRRKVLAYYSQMIEMNGTEDEEGEEGEEGESIIPSDDEMDEMSLRELCDVLRSLHYDGGVSWAEMGRKIGVSLTTIRVWALGDEAGVPYPFLPHHHHPKRIKKMLRQYRLAGY